MACKNVSSARGFLSMKWFTKGEIFTSCFNFDLIGVLVRKKCVKKCLFFSLVKKTFPPIVNDNEQGQSGGALRKIDNIFIEREGDILLSCKQILIVSLLSEIFT